MVPRTGGYAYDVGVWDLSIIEGPFSVARAKPLTLRFAAFASLQVMQLAQLQLIPFGAVERTRVLGRGTYATVFLGR
jgi:hypothetical protein